MGRADLATGLRTAQVGHALIGWTLDHGRPPESLVVLEVDDEEQLLEVADRIRALGLRYVLFYEPDLDDQATAIAVGPEGRKALSSLRLLR